jgi:phosphate transport system protein
MARRTIAATRPVKVAALRDDNELTSLVERACLIARDAVFNAKDLLHNSSRMAFLAVRDCEQELDQIESEIDERIASAITRVGETRARQLLACLKFITDLERIGDLVRGAAHRIHGRRERLLRTDSEQLIEMLSVLSEMLEQVHRGFTKRDVECARQVLRIDSRVDQICHALFQRHLAEKNPDPQGFEVLLIAQAFERVGDHAKNLAEELVSLSEGRSVRHVAKRPTGF